MLLMKSEHLKLLASWRGRGVFNFCRKNCRRISNKPHLTSDFGGRRPELVAQYVATTRTKTPAQKTERERCVQLLNLAAFAASKPAEKQMRFLQSQSADTAPFGAKSRMGLSDAPFSDADIWRKISREVIEIRQHLLPHDIAALLRSFAQGQYADKDVMKCLVKYLHTFSDIKSMLSCLYSLQQLKYPTADLEDSFLRRLQGDYDRFTYADLRSALIGITFILQRKLITAAQTSSECDGFAPFPSVPPTLTPTSLALSKATDTVVGTWVTTDGSGPSPQSQMEEVALDLCKAFYIRILEAELPIGPHSRHPTERRSSKVRKHQKELTLVQRAMIGLDPEDFFIIPLVLSRFGIFSPALLEQSIKRLKPFMVSRLNTSPLEPLVAAEGFLFWSGQFGKKGLLSYTDLFSTRNPILLKNIPKRQRHGFPTIGSNSVEDGSKVVSQIYAEMANKCLEYGTFLVRDITTIQLLRMRDAMMAHGLTSRPVWAMWAAQFEQEGHRRFEELAPYQLQQLAPIWRRLGKSVGRFHYKLNVLQSTTQLLSREGETLTNYHTH